MMIAGCPFAGEAPGTSQRGSEIAVDDSGNGYHGIYVGTPSLGRPGLLSGDPDSCVKLNTSDDFVFIGDASAFSFPTNVFAIEFLFRPDYTSFYEGILGKWDANWEYAIYRDGTNIQFRTYNAGGTAVYSTSYTVTDLAAHHYVWVADGANARLYVDASLATTVAKSGSSMADTTAPLILGKSGPVTNLPLVFIGVQDQLKQGMAGTFDEQIIIDTTGTTPKTATDSFPGLTDTATLVISGAVPFSTAELTTLSDGSTVAGLPMQLTETASVNPMEPPSTATAVNTSDALRVNILDPYVFESSFGSAVGAGVSDSLHVGLDELTANQDQGHVGLVETATLSINVPFDVTGSDSLHVGLDELTSRSDTMMGLAETSSVSTITP